MKTTASNIIRLAGLSAIASGISFIVIQAIHPIDVLPSVGTGLWAITHYLGIAMGIFGLFGVTGIYARQVEESGWLGFAAFLLLGLFYVMTTAFQFVEALITPALVSIAPQYVEGFLGIVTGHVSEVSLGALPTVYGLTGFVGYIFGGLLFGIATFRAGVLPRWSAVLLAVATLLPLASSLVPHPYDRLFAVPMGLALIALGYSLWSERRANVAASSPVSSGMQLRQTAAK